MDSEWVVAWRRHLVEQPKVPHLGVGHRKGLNGIFSGWVNGNMMTSSPEAASSTSSERWEQEEGEWGI